MKNLLSIFLIWLCFHSLELTAQPLDMYIPDNAVMVVDIQPERLNQKMSFTEMKQLSFMTELINQLRGMSPQAANALEDPSTIGVDGMKPMYMYVTKVDEGFGFNFIMKLKDANKLDGFFNEMQAPFQRAENNQSLRYMDEGEMVVSWNNNLLMISSYGDDNDDADYDMYEPDEEWEDPDWEFDEEEDDEDENEMEEEAEQMVEELLEEEVGMSPLDYAMQSMSPRQKSFLQNPQFKSTRLPGAQIGFWMDYSLIGKLQESFGNDGYQEEWMQMLQQMGSKMNNATYLSGGLFYDKGVANMKINYKMNDNTADYYRKMTDHKLNKKFFRYVDAQESVASVSFAYNFEEMMTGMVDLYKPMLTEMPVPAEAVDQVVDILDIFFDEDDIYDLIKGDGFMTFNGMDKVEAVETMYDEDFNSYKDTVMKSWPSMTMMFSTGSEEDLQKFMNLGETMTLLNPASNNSYYSLSLPMGENLDGPVNFALKDGILFISTDPAFAAEVLPGNISKSNRLSKKNQKAMRKSSQYVYLDFDNMVGTVKDAFKDDMMTSMAVNMFAEPFLNTMDDMTITSTKMLDNNMIQTVMAFNYDDKDTNSLKQTMLMINELFLRSLNML